MNLDELLEFDYAHKKGPSPKTTKICRKCGKELSIEHFPVRTIRRAYKTKLGISHYDNKIIYHTCSNCKGKSRTRYKVKLGFRICKKCGKLLPNENFKSALRTNSFTNRYGILVPYSYIQYRPLCTSCRAPRGSYRRYGSKEESIEANIRRRIEWMKTEEGKASDKKARKKYQARPEIKARVATQRKLKELPSVSMPFYYMKGIFSIPFKRKGQTPPEYTREMYMLDCMLLKQKRALNNRLIQLKLKTNEIS